MSGEKPKGGTLEIKDDGKMILMMHNGNYCATKSEDKETVEISKLADGKCEIQENNSGAQTIRDMGVVTSGDGLYVNEPNLGGGHVFKGTNPNNLLLFDNKCWSVISVEDNDEIKIIYEGEAAGSSCVRYDGSNYEGLAGSLSWTETTIDWINEISFSSKTKLEILATGTQQWNWFKKLTQLDKISDHTWYMGAVDISLLNGGNLTALLQQEKNEKHILWSEGSSNTWTNKLGLVNVSDVVKASANTACITGVWGDTIGGYLPSVCNEGNYLVKNTYSYWTLNAVQGKNVVAVVTKNASDIVGAFYATNSVAVRPVLYLNSDVEITGTGTSADPFVVA